MESNYPEAVTAFSEKLVGGLHDTGFFSDYEINDADVIDKAATHIQQAAFESWLADGEISISEETMEIILHKIIAEDTLNKMQNKGLISSIEDESGTEVFFLTEKGKEIANDILGL